MRRIWVVLAALLPTALGCGGGTVIERESAEAEILQADLEFAAALAGRDLPAFRGFLAEDAKFYGMQLLTDADAVAQAWGVYFDESSGTTLHWSPDVAEVGASTDLGFTRGRYEMRTTGDDGEVVSQYGYYVSIWRKGEDGRWRAAVDIGTPPAAEPVPEG
jgi:ketosteroid isomerase-like protein